MTTLDERARTASRALHEAVAVQAIASVEPARDRRSHRPLVAAVALVAVLALAVGVLAQRADRPAASAPVRSIRLPVGDAADVLIDNDGTAWVLDACAPRAEGLQVSSSSCRTMLLRVDAVTGVALDRWLLPSGIGDSMTRAFGSIWVVGMDRTQQPPRGALVRVAPNSGRVQRTWHFTAGDASRVVEAYGYMWVLDRTQPVLARVDVRTGAVDRVTVAPDRLGAMQPNDLFSVAGMLATTAVGPTDHGVFYTHVLRIDAVGQLSNEVVAKGPLVAAAEGIELYTSDTVDAVIRHPVRYVGQPYASFVDVADRFIVRDVRQLALTTSTIWMLDGRGAVKRVARPTQPPEWKAVYHDHPDVETVIDSGRVDAGTARFVTGAGRAWLLDRRSNRLYALPQ
jgi:hypothetical protein